MNIQLPTIMKVISSQDRKSKIIIYEDGVIVVTDGACWTEFYNDGKIRKFERYEPYSTYEAAAQRYTGKIHEVPNGFESKSPLESLVTHVCKTAHITFSNRA